MTLSPRIALLAALTTSALALPAAAYPMGSSAATPPPAATVTDAATLRPVAGAAGIGDPLFPLLGNGGYDATHYDLNLRYATARPSQGIDGTLTMTARATESLSRFDLDFGGDSIGSVRVDGRPASFRRTGDELIITPAKSIRRHHVFRVRVSHFKAHPSVASSKDFLSTAFFVTPDGSGTAGQPNNMHKVFPSNDHPRDKATFSFRFDVPNGQLAVANGMLTGKRTNGSRSIWTYEQRQPMATQLTQLAVGKYRVVKRRSVSGVRIRDVVPTRLLSQYRDKLAVVGGQMRWMERRAGRYPFATYGSFIADADLGFALETQTLSLYDTVWFTKYPKGVWDPVMLHELSHQWFGDSVALYAWSDLWESEGHATWYELTYAAEKGYLKDRTGVADFDTLMAQIYSLGDQWRANYGPVARPRSGDPNQLFNHNVYEGGALVCYALRQKIGRAAFERVEREWARQYRGRSVSTEAFIRFATRISGHDDVDPFLRRWLYETKTPPMPGHPDWTVAPVGSSAAKAATRSMRAAGGPHQLRHR